MFCIAESCQNMWIESFFLKVWTKNMSMGDLPSQPPRPLAMVLYTSCVCFSLVSSQEEPSPRRLGRSLRSACSMLSWECWMVQSHFTSPTMGTSPTLHRGKSWRKTQTSHFGSRYWFSSKMYTCVCSACKNQLLCMTVLECDCASALVTLQCMECAPAMYVCTQADERFFWNKTMLADLLEENYKVPT